MLCRSLVTLQCWIESLESFMLDSLGLAYHGRNTDFSECAPYIQWQNILELMHKLEG